MIRKPLLISKEIKVNCKNEIWRRSVMAEKLPECIAENKIAHTLLRQLFDLIFHRLTLSDKTMTYF